MVELLRQKNRNNNIETSDVNTKRRVKARPVEKCYVGSSTTVQPNKIVVE